ncbi:hypothetical protein GCM10010211_43660 [Streptomyces albospinus]|uniref:Uncharacterized protein n=1 Tax=Streptomyces albospinus TaxID=285515 RepID=A0ABQ2V931_9ACTN|nr:hypothetical protein GCM10010211_43660 [Streptomyces albospinus]
MSQENAAAGLQGGLTQGSAGKDRGPQLPPFHHRLAHGTHRLPARGAHQPPHRRPDFATRLITEALYASDED